MIVVNHLTKAFNKQTVLRDVNLTFANATVTAVIGPNGSGKTTLMKCIVGLVRPDKGTITLDGISTLAEPAVRSRIGYMSQVARYPENLSGKDLINMVRGLRSHSHPDVADELINDMQLSSNLAKPMSALSGGTRQKVGAVLALMFSPAALLLDEPTAGLDPIVTERLKDRIAHARSEGASVVITSHVLAEIQEVADRIVYLHEGIVVYDGTLTDLLDKTEQQSLSRAVIVLMREQESASSPQHRSGGAP